jgi:hypothetical protein
MLEVVTHPSKKKENIMAFYRTVVARTGFVDEMIKDMASNSTFVSRDGEWRGLVAADEVSAIEAANDKFLSDSIFSDTTLAEGSTDAWEIMSNESYTVIGWSMTADGSFNEDFADYED